MMSLHVGQTVYALNINNAARGREQVLIPVVVKKTGRKYFTCETSGGLKDMQFHIDSLRQKTEYMPNYLIYLSEQDYLDEKESFEIINLINSFSKYKNRVTLIDLRKIRDILQPYTKEAK